MPKQTKTPKLSALERIKELNLQSGDPVEVNRIYLSDKEPKTLFSDSFLGYYIKPPIENKDNFYMTHSKYLSMYASEHPVLIKKKSNLIHSFPLEEINTITKK